MSAFNGYMQGRNEGDKGGTIPRTPNHFGAPNHCGGRREIPKMS